MWPDTNELRLRQWHDLRRQAQQQELAAAMSSINNWWWQVPTVNHYLHWDDHPIWPGPWDLLADDHWCELARALGMLYTLMLVPRNDISGLDIVYSRGHNLVQVNDGKYILNWAPGQLLNIGSENLAITKKISSSQLQHHIG